MEKIIKDCGGIKANIMNRKQYQAAKAAQIKKQAPRKRKIKGNAD